MSGRLVTVFGGSGFVGRYVVQKLADRGDRVRVAVRRPNEALFLKPLGDVGQIQLMAANVNDQSSVDQAVAGADVVINLVGILYQSGSQKFHMVQAEGAGRVAAAAKKAGVKAMIHMSAIGADENGDAKYAVSKALGEKAVLDAFPEATIFRPSLIIGAEDGFFNRFAKLLKLLPVLPVPGLETRFQPVYVGDVADAIVKVCDGDSAVTGQTFELGGPAVYTMRELLHILMDHIDVHRPLFNMPFAMAKFEAIFTGLLPNPPLTIDQVKLLMRDNVVAEGSADFGTLAMTARPVEAVLPLYATQYRPRGQYS